MRATAVLIFVAACASDGSAPVGCPAVVEEGASCSTPADKWCYQAGEWCGLDFLPCRCESGRFVCDSIYPTDGAACPYPAEDPVFCYREGPGGCNDWGQPSGSSCGCSDGAWVCDDLCWDTCPATHRPSIEGVSCNFTSTCTYATHTCTCSSGTITCTSP